MPKKIFTETQKQEIIKRYTSGESSEKIGKDFNCSNTTLLKNLKEWGIPVNSKKLDLTGQVFGELIALRLGEKQGKENTWVCRCSCGNETTVKISNLRNGHTKSCGCLKNRPSKLFIDLTGLQFGEWTVLKKSEKESYWLCQCSCGKQREVYVSSLKRGLSKSCGHIKAGKIKKPIIGLQFGLLKVEEQLPYGICKCKCDCGKTTYVKRSNLTSGNTKSCGCNSYVMISKDLKNKRFGFLEPLFPTEKRQHGSVIWHCLCHNCMKECDISAHSLMDGKTCSCGCKHMSIGEYNIQNILENYDIKFEKQKSYQDCISPETNAELRYDFYLPDFNRLIEFDGKQHFQEIEYFGGKEEFIKRQILDIVKNEYALSNNIDLIRIPYWERDNITLEMILGKHYLVTIPDIEEAEETMVEVEE